MSEAGLERFELEASDGVKLAGYRWAAAEPRGVLLMMHGYAEHASRHGGLALAAANAGFDTWSFDQRNHGASPGVARGLVSGYEPALADLTALAAVARHARPEFEPFLFGHSMGGAMSLRYGLDYPERLAGLVLSAPFLLDGVARPAWLSGLLPTLARLLPKLPTAKLDASLISRDPDEVARYQQDPLVYHGAVRAAAGATMVAAGEELLARAPQLAVDTLLLHGGADGVASVEGSRRLATASKRVEFHELAGAYHEMHHDPPSSGAPQQARQLILDWLAARVVAP